MITTRRKFIKMGGLTAATTLLPLGGIPFASAQAGSGMNPNKKLVVIYLRFGADGMYLVSPTSGAFQNTTARDFYLDTDTISAEDDPKTSLGRDEFFTNNFDYKNLIDGGQGTSSLSDITYSANPADTVAGLPLIGVTDFQLYPAMKEFQRLFDLGQMSIVHGCGGQGTHSHFAAQDATEWARPYAGIVGNKDGWLYGIVNADITATSAFTGVNTTATPIQSFSGPLKRELMSTIGDLTQLEIDTDAVSRYRELLDDLYPQSGGGDRQTIQKTGYDALQVLQAGGSYQPAANYPTGNNPSSIDYYTSLADAAQLIKSNVNGVNVRCIHVDADLGWDSHSKQASSLAKNTKKLNDGLAAFIADLQNGTAADGSPKDFLEDTCILIMSEFGRTADVNGSQGTDHGEGGVMYVINNDVNNTNNFSGRKFYQVPWSWPESLAMHNGWRHPAGRYYVPSETDFREVYADIMQGFLGMNITDIQNMFGGAGVGGVPLNSGRFVFPYRPGQPNLFL
ncbi:MAG: DUF1501 domain-containing protein [Pseudomonadales bacterium]